MRDKNTSEHKTNLHGDVDAETITVYKAGVNERGT